MKLLQDVSSSFSSGETLSSVFQSPDVWGLKGWNVLVREEKAALPLFRRLLFFHSDASLCFALSQTWRCSAESGLQQSFLLRFHNNQESANKSSCWAFEAPVRRVVCSEGASDTFSSFPPHRASLCWQWRVRSVESSWLVCSTTSIHQREKRRCRL